MNYYAVYVSDASGWNIDCPDSEGTFFGDDHGGQYFRHAFELADDDADDKALDLGNSGCVVVHGRAAAIALRDSLSTGGDWVVDGREYRPTYASASSAGHTLQ